MNSVNGNPLVFFFVILWMLAGVVAFFWSIACFGANGGSTGSKVFGLLVAVIFGPFWFLYKYLAAKDGYCQNVPEQVVIKRYQRTM